MTETMTPAALVERDMELVCTRAATDLRALEGSSVLLTGGAGFLGHGFVHAIDWWNRHGADRPVSLVVADNWIRGRPAWLDRLESTPHVRLVTFDVTQPWTDDLVADWVIHAATIASPTFYREHPIETMDANVVGLRQLLELASTTAAGRLRGLLFFSSSEVYGDPDPKHIPTPESYVGRVSFTGPRACYDESKRYGETMCVNFARQRGVPVSSARPFNNYGPGLKIEDRRVIPDFARDIIAGRDVTMLSTGRPTRTFCYVADALVGYLAVLVRGHRGDAYNVGSDSPEISMRDLAHLMVTIAADELGYTGKVTTAASDDPAYLTDNPDRRCPDLTKLQAELAVTPAVELDEGLRRSLLWYRGVTGST